MAKRLFVLDSNVLMHDPTALFRFQEHDLFLPMMVLEELDNNKKGRSEVARNARQTSRFIDDLITDATQAQIEAGITLNSILNTDEENLSSGKLFFQTRSYKAALPDYLPGNLPDNNILGTTLALSKELKNHEITLVTKDINLRIKAASLGIKVEDYHNDRVLEDVDLLYTGTIYLKDDFGNNMQEKWIHGLRKVVLFINYTALKLKVGIQMHLLLVKMKSNHLKL